jgi:hypothetical protein
MEGGSSGCKVGLPSIGPLVWLGCGCSWFETELGRNKERVRDEMEKVLLISRGDQAFEFKSKFEFQQTK